MVVVKTRLIVGSRNWNFNPTWLLKQNNYSIIDESIFSSTILVHVFDHTKSPTLRSNLRLHFTYHCNNNTSVNVIATSTHSRLLSSRDVEYCSELSNIKGLYRHHAFPAPRRSTRDDRFGKLAHFCNFIAVKYQNKNSKLPTRITS